MCDDIVAVLLRCQFIRCCNNLLNHRLVDVAPGELLEHPLNDSAATLVFAEQQNLILNQINDELDFVGGYVENDALDNVVAFLTEHHLKQKLLIKLGDDLLLLLQRQPNERFLNDPASKLIK